MNYEIQFFAASVQALIEKWPAGIYASFVRIAEQMVMSGPNLGMPYTKAMGVGQRTASGKTTNERGSE